MPLDARRRIRLSRTRRPRVHPGQRDPNSLRSWKKPRATRSRSPPRGARTGLTGGSVPEGGWAISMEKFHQLDISTGCAKPLARGVARSAADGGGAFESVLRARPHRAHRLASAAPSPTMPAARAASAMAARANMSAACESSLMDGRVLNVKRGDQVDFPVPKIPLPNVTKNTAGYPLSPGMDWIDLFHRQRRHARHRHRSRIEASSETRRRAGRRGLLSVR